MYQKDQKFTFGNATFKNISKKNKEIIKKSKKIKSTMNNLYWNIKKGDYQKYNWKEIFSYMSECLAQEVNLWKNYRIQMITQIQYAQYSNLKKLYLSQNRIRNIQALSSIRFNCLQQLALYSNQICQIKNLKKLSVPSLDKIYLRQNPLIEINALTRSEINLKQLEGLQLQSFYLNNPINQNLNVIVKLSSKSVESLYVESDKRISQVKVQSMLKLRSPSIQIKKGKLL